MKCFGTNSNYEPFNDAIQKVSLSENDIRNAEERLNQSAPYIAKVFPETKETKGIIRITYCFIPTMQSKIEEIYNQEILGRLFLKCDSHFRIN